MAGNTVYVQGSYVDVHDNEVVNLSIDKATVKLDENEKLRHENGNEDENGQQDEERFHFIHPEIEDDEAWRIHHAVKRLVSNQKVPEICAYLKEQKLKGKMMLPSTSSVMYNELVRLGMPTGGGYTEKHFSNYYMK